MPRNPGNTNVSDSEIKEMINFHHQGTSPEGIAKLTKRSLATVKRILADYLRPDE